MRLCSSEFPYRIFGARNESDISIGGYFKDKYKDDVVLRDDTKAFGNAYRRNGHYNETDGNRRRDEPMVLRIGSEKPVTELHQTYGFMNSPCTENSSEYGTP